MPSLYRSGIQLLLWKPNREVHTHSPRQNSGMLACFLQWNGLTDSSVVVATCTLTGFFFFFACFPQEKRKQKSDHYFSLLSLKADSNKRQHAYAVEIAGSIVCWRLSSDGFWCYPLPSCFTSKFSNSTLPITAVEVITIKFRLRLIQFLINP